MKNHPRLANASQLFFWKRFLLITFKPIATGLTLGSGGNGGNFAPSLFMGAYTGFVVSYSLNLAFNLNLPVANFTLVGMAGVLSGLYHAPLTAIFLIAEITGGYGLMIPLMIVSSISFAISKYFEPFSMDTKKNAEKGEIISSNKDEQVLLSLQVQSLIDKEYEVIIPTLSLGELVEIIKTSPNNIFPVLDRNEHFLGVLMVENVKNVIFETKLYNQLQVVELMTIPKYIVTENENIESILEAMDQNGYWFVPVVYNNVFQGFISKNKILTTYRNRLKNEIIE